MDVCGIDPGLGVSGYAVVGVGDAAAVDPRDGAIDPRDGAIGGRGAAAGDVGAGALIRDAGVCRTDPEAELPARLAQIERDVAEVFEQWRPAVVGVEQLYAHYKHPRTAILMGHARGVILSVAARFDIPVRSYSATQVKRFLTGNGRASKPQIQRAIMRAFNLAVPPEPNDVADALAVALCCAESRRRATHAL